ncbi:chemotaxis protein CheA [Dactylosporangium roseum]|uniref:histidine kinase n=1 Tax=Dactylosporangium roseum TaxID=47989 RepID=A0ABY5YWE2_9ACTN|nr:chemotaxis protein CheA [Dactylosporangium roseum]UWZ33842.1 chemotaxis protein CheA [Dactylosporangium roseum]
MNPLLAQFLAEAGDLLDQVGEGLLRLESDPGDAERVNEVFRAAHTLKGSSGLFDFPELTHLTHAAEDLLDAVRAGHVPLDSALTDDLLAAFDLIRSWLAHVTVEERLPGGAETDAAALIVRLRAPIGGPAAGGPAASAGTARAAGVASRAPGWVAELGAQVVDELTEWLGTTSATLRFVRYLPDEGCYFRGEDPLLFVRQVPALHHLEVLRPDVWPAPDEYDEYACRLGFVLATRAAVSELEYVFRYVSEQVEIVELDAAALRAPVAPDPAGPPDETVADVVAVLDAAAHALAPHTGGAPAGAHLRSVARSVAAAARTLGTTTADLDTADAEGIASTVRDLLDRVRGTGGAPAAAATADVHPTHPVDPVERRPGDAETGQVGTRMLKVDQAKVDRLMELAGELNVAKNSLTYLAEAAEEGLGGRALSRRIKDQYAGLHRIAEELQAAVMDVRMLPLSVSFCRFPRLVRDLSRRLGKRIELVTEGGDTMADKDVIEALGDPLVHLVRNSLDHGIEPPDERTAAGKPPQAAITLSAIADGDAVVVEVADDGRGIDPARVKLKAYERGLIDEEQLASIGDADAVNLVFQPGFSTADQVSDLSGRGVGMDAVRASVERLGGTVTMRSELGAGTVARLRLPLSMAVTQVMVVSVAGQRFGIPVDLVVETVRVPRREIGRVLHQDVVVLREEVVPVVDLAETLGMPWQPEPGADRAVLVVNVAGGRAGLLVERFHREVDVILKPMDGLLRGAPQFVGTALLGDGLVLLVLNLKEVIGLGARAA